MLLCAWLARERRLPPMTIRGGPAVDGGAARFAPLRAARCALRALLAHCLSHLTPTHNTRADPRARQGWVSGTGGGISVKAADGRIVMAPSGVQKERMRAEDMFVLDAKGDVLEAPAARPPPYPAPKLSECSPLFMAVR